MSDIEGICPPWFPELLWQWLRNHPPPPPPPGDGDGWPIIENVLVNLHMYVMSFGMKNEQAALQIRKISETELADSMKNLNKLQLNKFQLTKKQL